MFFFKSYLPTDEYIEWLFDTWSWLLREFGGWERFRETPLVLPTPDFYPEMNLKGHALAEELFKQTQRHAGLEDWPCVLEPQEEPDVNAMMDGMPHSYQSDGAAGTFSVQDDDRVVITYSEKNLKEPMSLIATLAHELAHYLLVTAESEPPKGDEAHEPATDVASIFLGFGVSLCNSALVVRSREDYRGSGWSASRKGYLDEKQLAYALAVFCALREIPPKTATTHLTTNPRSYIKAACKDLEKRWREDLARLREISAARPLPTRDGASFAKAHLDKGFQFLAKEKFDRAVVEFSKALARRRDSKAAYEGRITALQAMGDTEAALKDSEQLVSLDPDKDENHNRHAMLLMALGEFDSALESFDAALAINPDHHQAHIARASVYGRQGRHDEELADLNEAIRIDPQHPGGYHFRAMLRLIQGQGEDAIADLTTCLTLAPDQEEILRIRAEAYERVGNFRAATEDYGRLINMDPFEPTTLRRRAWAFHRMGAYDEALAEYESILEIHADDAATFWMRGHTLLNLDQPEQAREEWNRIVSGREEDPEAWFTRASIAFEYAMPGQAIEDLNEAVGLKPDYAEALLLRSQLRELTTDHAGAIEDCNRLVELNPNDASGYVQRAWCRLQAGEFQQAEEDCRAARELSPDDPRIDAVELQISANRATDTSSNDRYDS